MNFHFTRYVKIIYVRREDKNTDIVNKRKWGESEPVLPMNRESVHAFWVREVNVQTINDLRVLVMKERT